MRLGLLMVEGPRSMLGCRGQLPHLHDTASWRKTAGLARDAVSPVTVNQGGNHQRTSTALPLLTESHSRWHSTSASRASCPLNRSASFPEATAFTAVWISSVNADTASPPPRSGLCDLPSGVYTVSAGPP